MMISKIVQSVKFYDQSLFFTHTESKVWFLRQSNVRKAQFIVTFLIVENISSQPLLGIENNFKLVTV